MASLVQHTQPQVRFEPEQPKKTTLPRLEKKATPKKIEKVRPIIKGSGPVTLQPSTPRVKRKKVVRSFNPSPEVILEENSAVSHTVVSRRTASKAHKVKSVTNEKHRFYKIIHFCQPYVSYNANIRLTAVAKEKREGIFINAFHLGKKDGNFAFSILQKAQFQPLKLTESMKGALIKSRIGADFGYLDFSNSLLEKGALELLARVFPNIRSFSLAHTKVFENDYRALGSLSQLEYLDLSESPQFFEKPKRLLPLLKHGPLEGDGEEVMKALLPQFQNLTKLRTLGMAKWKNIEFSTNPLPQSMRELDVQDSRISDEEIFFLSETPLTKVILSDCIYVTDTALQSLSTISTLTTLSVVGCLGITERGLSFFKEHPSLTGVDCSLIANDAWVERLNELPHLQELYLSESDITDAGLKKLRTKNLQRLDISLCGDVTEAGLSSLKRFPLKMLDVSFTVKDSWFLCLNAFMHLEELFAEHSTISDAGLKKLKSKTLRYINLQSSSQISSVGVEGLIDRIKPLTRVVVSECARISQKDGAILMEKFSKKGKLECLAEDFQQLTLDDTAS